MEFQELDKPKKEKQVPKAILETAYAAFLNNKEAWRQQLTFARDFPDNRLKQAVIFLKRLIMKPKKPILCYLTFIVEGD